MMTEVALRRIAAAVESLSASSLLTIYTDGLEVLLRGRCSPYVSHREIEFRDWPHNPGGDILFTNGKHALVWSPVERDPAQGELRAALIENYQGATGLVHDVQCIRVPWAAVEPLAEIARTNFVIRKGQRRYSTTVIMIALPVLERYGDDDDRRPIYKAVEFPPESEPKLWKDAGQYEFAESA